MTVLRRTFFEDENGVDDRWHSLALDDETGRIFVISGYVPRDQDYYETETGLADFIVKADVVAVTELFALIATLFDDDREDDFVWRRSLA